MNEVRAIQVQWIETESTNIKRYGWSPAHRVLVVEFKSGATYHYFDVSEALFLEMQGAASAGKFLARAIKGVFRYGQV